VPRPAVELDWERSPVMFQGDGRVFRKLRLRGGNVESHFDPRLFAFSRRVRSATTDHAPGRQKALNIMLIYFGYPRAHEDDRSSRQAACPGDPPGAGVNAALQMAPARVPV
jgi:hypothetical protein